MRLRGAKQVHYDSGPNMTPLVDVVMVILIFLMMAGNFGGVTTFIMSKQAIKKSGGTAQKLKPGEVPDVNVEIRVDNLNPRDLEAGFVTHGPGVEGITDPERLRVLLAQKRQEFVRAGTPANQLLVVISPGQNTQYHYLIDVYQAALQANFEKVAFATSR